MLLAAPKRRVTAATKARASPTPITGCRRRAAGGCARWRARHCAWRTGSATCCRATSSQRACPAGADLDHPASARQQRTALALETAAIPAGGASSSTNCWRSRWPCETKALAKEHAAPVIATGLLSTLLQQRLPFRLTAPRKRALAETLADMARGQPMTRLLQGRGGGKTVVAALAALAAVEAGQQVAFMAPTELLAEQHFNKLRHWLAELPVTITATGSLAAGELKAAQAACKRGETHVPSARTRCSRKGQFRAARGWSWWMSNIALAWSWRLACARRDTDRDAGVLAPTS